MPCDRNRKMLVGSLQIFTRAQILFPSRVLQTLWSLVASFKNLLLIPGSCVSSRQKEQRLVQMMFQEGTFRLAHIEEVQAQVLELPYAGEELSMVILLPDDHVALSSVS